MQWLQLFNQSDYLLTMKPKQLIKVICHLWNLLEHIFDNGIQINICILDIIWIKIWKTLTLRWRHSNYFLWKSLKWFLPRVGQTWTEIFLGLISKKIWLIEILDKTLGLLKILEKFWGLSWKKSAHCLI